MWWMRWTAKSGSLGGPGASEPMRGCSTRVGACQAEAPISCKFYDGRIFLRSLWGHLFQNVPLVCQRPSKTSPQCVCAVAGRFMPLSRGNRPLKDERGKPWSGTLAMHMAAYGWKDINWRWHGWTCSFWPARQTFSLFFLALAIVFQFVLFHSLMPGITLKVESSIMYSKITSIDACIGTWFWNSKIDHTYAPLFLWDPRTPARNLLPCSCLAPVDISGHDSTHPNLWAFVCQIETCRFRVMDEDGQRP